MDAIELSRPVDAGGGELRPSASSLSISRSWQPWITAMLSFSRSAKPVTRLAWFGVRATITELRQSGISNGRTRLSRDVGRVRPYLLLNIIQEE